MKHAYLYFALAFAPWAAADGPRDPTRPPQPKTQLAVVHESAPVLSAIISSNSRRVAIFNGQVVRSGDSVGSYSIEEVSVNSVRYRHAGRTQELHLPHPDSFKRIAKVPRLVAGAQ